jgi:hypothetical protein
VVLLQVQLHVEMQTIVFDGGSVVMGELAHRGCSVDCVSKELSFLKMRARKARFPNYCEKVSTR